jgi:hypothetical protein
VKICPDCGDPYRDPIDFCFNDGAVLRAPTAEELLAVVSEARSSTGRRVKVTAPPPIAAVPGVDPVALALIAQVEAAVTRSVVTQRQTWWRGVAARRREALARFWARAGVFGVGVGCMVVLAVAVPVIGGAAYLVGQSASPSGAAGGLP